LNIYQQISTEKTSKNADSFVCSNCDFICSKKGDYNRHLLTDKHKNIIYSTDFNKIHQNTSKYICECGKLYKERTGLWYHKKKCKDKIEEVNENEYKDKQINNTEELIKYLMKENTEFKKMLIDQNKQMIEIAKNAGNNNTTNSHNKAFNLNFFLNETCKDAMNIMDFVDSIKLQLSDLENVGKLGYVNGISNIIIKNLKEIDIEKRPVHCTDKKRETMYVKDENKWEKDEENNKIRKAIKRVVSKNQRLFPKFKEAHPDCNTYHSKFSDQYNKLILESCGGSGDNDLEKEEKIIQNISKNVLVDK